jgi:hypothetical protein
VIDRSTVDSDEVNIYATLYVNAPLVNICIYRLFNWDKEKGKQDLDYDFYYFPSISKNVEVVLFDFDPDTGESVIMNDYIKTGQKVLSLEEL